MSRSAKSPSLRHALPLLFLLVASLAAPPARAGFVGFEPMGFPAEMPNGQGAERPFVPATRLNGGGLEVDGKLDEPVWRVADPAGRFLRWHPDRGRTPTEETIFKVAYDDNAIYFAVACLERDPANIASALSRRDQIRDSDFVSIYVDPYHDKNTGYNFRITPDGVQEDAYLYDDGNRDRDWNAVWEAETSRDEDGWYVEVRIPFSAVRYRPRESMTWGLQVYRFMQRRGEDTAWTIWGEQDNGFISRFGEIRELDDVSSPRRLETLPYFLQRTVDYSQTGPEQRESIQNFGLDLKYGMTPDLTLNATFQPDFGQVESDPATLNLSPFETFFQEKRPFFTEGAQFYEMPDFNLFYSRRIGTGDPNSRIRAAGKLTGKVAGNLSIAALYAYTDVSNPGQSHNFTKNGRNPEQFFVGRVGRDFADGNHALNFMGTAVMREPARTDEGFPTRNGYSAGTDFRMQFLDRRYALQGSFVGSRIVPAGASVAATTGHGGEVSAGKYGGQWRGSGWRRWESDELDLNDAGFLSAPNEINSGGWLGWRYVQGEDPSLNQANLNLNAYREWIYGAETVTQEETGEVLWSYDAQHPVQVGGNVNGYMQLRNYQGYWGGVRHNTERSDQYITRGGPLMKRPAETGGWVGMQTDWRRPISWEFEAAYVEDGWGGYFAEGEIENTWNIGPRGSISGEISYWQRSEKSDYIDTIEHDDPTLGIGGTSYVFGDLSQQTGAVTLRSNVLFSRSQSLELYLQPFLTVGDYSSAMELVTPDTAELVEYDRDGFRAEDSDFRFASMNVNLVYRWEYRPGSTLFLVFTHSRDEFQEREDNVRGFRNDFDPDSVFRSEAQNTFLAKITYWLPM